MSRAVALVLIPLFIASGCYNYTAIKPAELPKLNGATGGEVVDGPGAGSTIAVATRTVEMPDGRLKRVDGKFDIVIEAAGGEMTFEGPVQTTIDDAGNVTIKSSNHGPWTGPIAALQSVKVKQKSKGKTGAATFAGIFIPFVIVLAVLLSAA